MVAYPDPNKFRKSVGPGVRPDRVAQLINAVSPLMKGNDSTPYDIVRNSQLICEQYGIRLIDNFAKIPVYQQLTLVDCK